MAKKLNPLLIVLGLSSVFFVAFVAISAAIFMWSPSGSVGKPSFLGTSNRIGVIEVKGVILDSKKVTQHIRAFEKDASIKAILVRLDSPGGAVGPSQEIYQALKKSSKPVVASMGSVAASGAFYIACGAKKVFANPGTITGSIGVIMEFVNLKDLYQWAKVKRYAITTGKFKNVGASYKDMSPEENQILQVMINDVLEQFRAAVGEARGLSSEDVVKVSDGRIFSGAQAKAQKLIDETGTFQDAVDAAAELASIKGEPELVYPQRHPMRWMEFLMENPDEESGEARSVLGRVASRILGETKPLLGPGIYWLWQPTE